MKPKKAIFLVLFVLTMVALLIYVSLFSVDGDAPKESIDSPVLLVLIDAFDWDVVGEYIDSGDLPKFKEIKESGAHGNISVDIENYSPTYWTTAATGVKPEKHGITDWKKGDRFVTSQDVEVDSIWNILSRKGFQVGVFNWMVTWPPESVNGFMVSGVPILSDNITYPPELRQQLDKNNLDYDIGDVEVPKDTVRYLTEKYKPDFIALGDRYTYNLLQANWNYLHPEEYDITEEEVRDAEKVVLDAYRNLGNIIDELEEKYNKLTVFIVTDHGIQSRDEILYDTPFFMDFSERYFENVEECTGEEPGMFLKAGTNVNIFCLGDEETGADVKDMLQDIKNKKTGESFFEEININEQTVSAKFNFNPNHLKKREGYGINQKYIPLLLNDESIEFPVKVGYTVHDDEGIFMARGPEVREDFVIESKIFLEDISPTISYAMGLEIPGHFEGDHLEEIFYSE